MLKGVGHPGVACRKTDVLVFSCLLLLAPLPTALPANDDLELFERRIRPVLIERCYRCHNHKFDPISQADYYAMSKDANRFPNKASLAVQITLRARCTHRGLSGVQLSRVPSIPRKVDTDAARAAVEEQLAE